jgi:hypothetical protein
MVIRKFIGLSGWIGLLFAALAAVGQPLGARQASVPPPVSDSLVRHYLARAMTVQNLRLLPVAERRTFTQWAGAAGTRFAGRVGGFWATPRDAQQLQASADTLRQLVADLHRAQPAMVVQGTIFEVIEAHAADLPVPNAARAEFGEDTLAVPQRNFQFADMMYPAYFEADDPNHYRWDDRAPGQAPGIPDMSRPETQLWFYALARQQIDAGCEALHFGQVMRMDDRDAGHHAWWSLLQRVRAYARTRNRGFVLCPCPLASGSCCSTFTAARRGPSSAILFAKARTRLTLTLPMPATARAPFMGVAVGAWRPMAPTASTCPPW